MKGSYPFELRLPLAPYRFEWANEAAVNCDKNFTESYAEERYTHADGTEVVIRNYPADGSFHIMSDRGDIELIDRAGDLHSANPVSIVKLP